MTCEQAELRMAELLAGELAPEERAALDRHLLDCATCRADFELARAGARIEWADVSVPREVIESTLESFREPPPVVRFLRWATAAAAVFGVVALLLISSRAPRPVEEPVAAARTTERPQVLATMQDAVVGALVCRDEDGRPVGELGLKSHDVSVEILDGIAKTTVEENFENHTDRRLEGTFHFPLPSDASISRLALEVNGKIEEGTCLERERAREVFESIVRKAMDPALLEWQPGGFFKCRVFPIEPRSTKRVIVAYTQALPCFQGKMTYVYPLASEKTRTHPPGEASIAVQARFSGGLAKIASPSHHLDVQRKDANEASMAFRAANYRPNNDFVVTMEPGEEEVRVVSHKTDGDDGYFACFATPKGGGERVPGRYAFVLDASASINAPRLEVAKRLVRGMMERRIEGDRFEILAHNVEVERSGEVDLRAANDFMDRLRPIGGCDVLQALQAAGDAEVIYIGKGAATFGETEPSKILEAVKGRRIRTIAVGSDANGTLLERLGGMMRVNPNDDVTKRVEEIAATLGSPVLSEVKIDGGEAVYDVVGVRDLFYGERLVVSGRYRGPTAKLVITGKGYRREVDVAFPPKEEGNNYVRRLWAQRKVSDLLAQGPAKKPEVTELGVKYQIMTPYTSFLVLETEQMWKDFQLKREVQKQDEVLGKAGGEGQGIKGKLKPPMDLKPMTKSPAPVTVVEPVKPRNPTAKDPVDPRAGPVASIPAPRPTPETVKPRDVYTADDPKARAIREAYEEQLRRDRQEVTLNMLAEKAEKKVPEALYLKTGLDALVVKGDEREYDHLMKEALVRTDKYRVAMEEFGGLEFQLDGTDGDVMRLKKNLSAQEWHGYMSLPTTGGLPGATIRDALETETVTTAGRPFTNEDLSVLLRQAEVQLSQLQELEDRKKLTKSFIDQSRFQLEQQRESVGTLGKLEEALVETPQKMDVRMVQLKNIAPPASYTAKIEPGRTLEGRPLEGPDPSLLQRWTLAQYLESQLTKDAQGRVLGKLNYDPQSNSFIVRDTPQVLDRVQKILDAVAGPNGAAELERLSVIVQAGAACSMPTHALEVHQVNEDGGVSLRATGFTAAPQQLFAVTRGGKFVAMIRVERVSDSQVDARVVQNLAVGRILPGDRAILVTNPKGYLAALPEQVRMDLSSRANLQKMRANMELSR
jgi:Ca-activated chloride channel homolog